MVFSVEKNTIKNYENFEWKIAFYKKLVIFYLFFFGTYFFDFKSHPNFVKLHEVIFDFIQNKYYFVMDYMKKGVILSENFMKRQSPRNLSKEKDFLTTKASLNFFRQFLTAIDFRKNFFFLL